MSEIDDKKPELPFTEIAPEMRKHFKKLSSRGAQKGGIARHNALTPEQRKEIASQAARTRWGTAAKPESDVESAPVTVVKAVDDKPFSLLRGKLTIGEVEVECHVLSDHRRVITQTEIIRLLASGAETGNLTRYLNRNPLIDKDFLSRTGFPFTIPGKTAVGIGREATDLIEICEKYLEAREQGLLRPSQLKLAAQSEIIIRAAAKVGIIALIDEATGFQKLRERHALQLKFQAFIADELQEWARMFPEEFWLELARLEGIRYSPRSRPLRWGKYIMMFVYDAIDSDIGKELRKRNPNPHFKQNHHQWLKKFGRERVNNQLQRVITIMKLCDNMDDFRQKFAKVFRKSPLQMSFDDLWQ